MTTAHSLVTEDHLIPSGDPGIALLLRNRRPADLTAFTAERTLLFVHGGTQASEATFDLEFDGLSWMGYIAGRGWDVWFVDIRGFGGSTRPPEMSLPPEEAPPVARTAVAWRDFGAAVEHILALRGIDRLNALGWSWGTLISGGWAAQNPDKIRRLVQFGPAWAVTLPAPANVVVPGYALWTVAEAFARLQAGVPEAARGTLTPDSWYRAWEAATVATDPEAFRHDPPRVRSPAGVYTDFAEAARSGRPLYDPAAITAETLLVVGEWDGLSTPSQARELFRHLTGARAKRLVELGGATHFAHLERRRLELFETVQGFLEGA
jgi:pimeloyl-ACP methyl ester carboxylesterase